MNDLLTTEFRQTLRTEGLSEEVIERILPNLIDVQGATCLCRSRTCGPHRCWPSLWGWAGFTLTLIYAIFIHSSFYSQRATEYQLIHTTLQTGYDQQLTALHAVLTQEQADWTAWRRQVEQDYWKRFQPSR